MGGSVSWWLACWTQAQKAWFQIAAAMLSSNSLRQTVHTHRASVHQAAKLVAALLRVARVIVGLAESNGSLPSGLWLTSPAGWLLRTGISSGTLCSVIEYTFTFLALTSPRSPKWFVVQTPGKPGESWCDIARNRVGTIIGRWWRWNRHKVCVVIFLSLFQELGLKSDKDQHC